MGLSILKGLPPIDQLGKELLVIADRIVGIFVTNCAGLGIYCPTVGRKLGL